VLARVRTIISTAEPFEPATSRRRFTIGAPDGASAVFLPPLLAALRRNAPGIDIGVRQLLPTPGEASSERAWRVAFADLEARALDIAVIPSEHIPARFLARRIYEEDFVVAVRAGHPFVDDPTLERYCEMKHLVVSLSAEPYGFVDEALAQQGRSRRVALTVPNFMFALAVISETDDLLCALPRRFVAAHAARFGVLGVRAPLPLTTFRLNAVVPKAATMDLGLAWLFDQVASLLPEKQKRRKPVADKKTSPAPATAFPAPEG